MRYCLISACLMTLTALANAATPSPRPTSRRIPTRPQPSRSAPRSTTPASTTFEGNVVTVRRESFPDIILVLEISQTGTPAAVKGRGDQKRLPARTRLRSASGAPDFENAGIVGLTGAYYLLPGDRIRGAMHYAEGEWLLDSVERLPSATPAKVAQLRVELSIPDESYPQGEAVPFSLTVTNRGTAAAVFNFPTGQRFDCMVKQHGQEIWRWSQGQVFPQNATTITLGPGESMTFREKWPGMDTRGTLAPTDRYTLVGWLTASGQEALTESSAEIRVEEGETTQSGLSIEDIIANPRYYANKEVTLVGAYRAQLGERGEPLIEGGPPTSRNDWILQDLSGSIYVSGSGQATLTPEHDLNARLRVRGLLRMNSENRLYLRALSVERLPGRS